MIVSQRKDIFDEVLFIEALCLKGYKVIYAHRILKYIFTSKIYFNYFKNVLFILKNII